MLSVEFATREGVVRAVSEVDLDLAAGETLAIVGESGSGKSQMLLEHARAVGAKRARHAEARDSRARNWLARSEKRLNQIRGAEIGFVFQDPMTSLNPYLTIGLQLTEPLRVHKGADRAAAAAQAIEMLKAVHITEPERRMQQYPHQLSGGMRQRVAIAMALICRPEMLIADEPTTALDVTVQAQVLSLLREIRERFGTAIILVTHDLGVIAELADRVNVMYAGRIVETGIGGRYFLQLPPSLHGSSRALDSATHRRSARSAWSPSPAIRRTRCTCLPAARLLRAAPIAWTCAIRACLRSKLSRQTTPRRASTKARSERLAEVRHERTHPFRPRSARVF